MWVFSLGYLESKPLVIDKKRLVELKGYNEDMIFKYILESRKDSQVFKAVSRLETGGCELREKVKQMLLALRHASISWRSER